MISPICVPDIHGSSTMSEFPIGYLVCRESTASTQPIMIISYRRYSVIPDFALSSTHLNILSGHKKPYFYFFEDRWFSTKQEMLDYSSEVKSKRSIKELRLLEDIKTSGPFINRRIRIPRNSLSQKQISHFKRLRRLHAA